MSPGSDEALQGMSEVHPQDLLFVTSFGNILGDIKVTN